MFKKIFLIALLINSFCLIVQIITYAAAVNMVNNLIKTVALEMAVGFLYWSEDNEKRN